MWMTNKCRTRMVHRELYNVRGLPNGEREERKTEIPLRALFSGARWKLTSSNGEFVSSDYESIQLCVPSSYSIISNIHVNCCQTHWSLALGPTLYKFIVMGPLGLDPIHYWVRSENRDLTIFILLNKVVILNYNQFCS